MSSFRTATFRISEGILLIAFPVSPWKRASVARSAKDAINPIPYAPQTLYMLTRLPCKLRGHIYPLFIGRREHGDTAGIIVITQLESVFGTSARVQ